MEKHEWWCEPLSICTIFFTRSFVVGFFLTYVICPIAPIWGHLIKAASMENVITMRGSGQLNCNSLDFSFIKSCELNDGVAAYLGFTM